MQKIFKAIIAIAVIALFTTGMQAKPAYFSVASGGSKNGDVPVVSG